MHATSDQACVIRAREVFYKTIVGTMCQLFCLERASNGVACAYLVPEYAFLLGLDCTRHRAVRTCGVAPKAGECRESWLPAYWSIPLTEEVWAIDA